MGAVSVSFSFALADDAVPHAPATKAAAAPLSTKPRRSIPPCCHAASGATSYERRPRPGRLRESRRALMTQPIGRNDRAQGPRRLGVCRLVSPVHSWRGARPRGGGDDDGQQVQLTPRVDGVGGDGVSPELREPLLDVLVRFRPVRLDGHGLRRNERSPHGVRLQDCPLVDLARGAPIRGEVHEDGSNRCRLQRPAAKRTSRSSSRFAVAGVTWLWYAPNSQVAVARRPKPITALKVAIHSPGFGRSRIKAGEKLSATNGAASPRPIAPKSAIVCHAGVPAASAKAAAVPRNGAVQGVDMTAAKRPFEKLARRPLLGPVVDMPSEISKTPSALRPNANTTATRMATNGGCWKCMPQPRRVPDARRAITISANERNATVVPAA